MKRLPLGIACNSLLTIYKMFVHPHLDYTDIIYGKPRNVNFESKLKRVQYNTFLAITGAIQATNKDSIYPVGNFMFKINNKNTRARCEICSKLTVKTPERRRVVLVSLWLTLNIIHTLF